MKKLLFAVIVFVFLFPTSLAFAQEITPSASPTPVAVDYPLPYPGMLPTNPLYFLKTFRDTIVSFFISDPQQKAEYALLQADKNIQATVILAKQQDEVAARKLTVQKATDAFAQAITHAKTVQQQGRETQSFISLLTTANLKHQEVLTTVLAETDGEVKTQIADFLKTIQKFEDQVNQLDQ